MVYSTAYNSKSLFQLGSHHMYMNGLIHTNGYKCLTHRYKDVKLLLKIIQYFSDLEARTDLLLHNIELYTVFITTTQVQQASPLISQISSFTFLISTGRRLYDAPPPIKKSLKHKQIFRFFCLIFQESNP